MCSLLQESCWFTSWLHNSEFSAAERVERILHQGTPIGRAGRVHVATTEDRDFAEMVFDWGDFYYA